MFCSRAARIPPASEIALRRPEHQALRKRTLFSIRIGISGRQAAPRAMSCSFVPLRGVSWRTAVMSFHEIRAPGMRIPVSVNRLRAGIPSLSGKTSAAPSAASTETLPARGSPKWGTVCYRRANTIQLSRPICRLPEMSTFADAAVQLQCKMWAHFPARTRIVAHFLSEKPVG